MKSLVLALLGACSALTFAFDSQAKSAPAGVDAQLDCKLKLKTGEAFSSVFHVVRNGYIEGMITRQDPKGEPSEVPFEGAYELGDATLWVSAMENVSRSRGPGLLPTVKPEQVNKFKIKFVKDKKWALHFFDPKSATYIKSAVPCEEK